MPPRADEGHLPGSSERGGGWPGRALPWLPVFAAYVALLFWTVRHHEPWADEAQAWLVARDLPLPYLVTRFMRYEGTPALWHLLLAAPAKLHAPYAVLNLLGAAIACVGVALLLWGSRLPRILKLLLPFTFFVLYQYAVVARNYVLVLPLLALVAVAARHRDERPLTFAGALFLLANVSVHCTAIACCLMSLEALRLLHGWKELPPTLRRRRLAALGAFGLGLALLVAQLVPPSDLSFPIGHPPSQERLDHVASALGEAFAGNLPATLIVLAISCAWFLYAGVLAEFLLPLVAVLTIFGAVHSRLWHCGVLFMIWVYALWRSFDRLAERAVPSSPARRRATGLVVAAFALVLGLQVYWAYGSVRADLRAPYSGSLEAARYLRRTGLDRERVQAGQYASTAILAYFDHNIFPNRDDLHGGSFWFWSKRQQVAAWLDPPPVGVVLAVKFAPLATMPWRTPDFGPPLLPGYVVTRYFEGAIIWKWRATELDSYVVAVRPDRVPAEDLPLPRVQYRLGMMALGEDRVADGCGHLEKAASAGAPAPHARLALAYCLARVGGTPLDPERLVAPELEGSQGMAALAEVEGELRRLDPDGARRLHDGFTRLHPGAATPPGAAGP